MAVDFNVDARNAVKKEVISLSHEVKGGSEEGLGFRDGNGGLLAVMISTLIAKKVRESVSALGEVGRLVDVCIIEVGNMDYCFKVS